MKLLCIDLEATCDNKGSGPYDSEIIEIGWSLIDCYDRRILGYGSQYVVPNRLPLSRFCTDLTGITDEKLQKEGLPLTDACKTFINNVQASGVDPREVPWISFGEWDETQFTRECLRKGVVYPLSFTHYNLKDILNDCFKDLIHLAVNKTKTFGLYDATKLLGLKFDGRHHSGQADAQAVSKLVLHLIQMLDLDVMKRLS